MLTIYFYCLFFFLLICFQLKPFLNNLLISEEAMGSDSWTAEIDLRWLFLVSYYRILSMPAWTKPCQIFKPHFFPDWYYWLPGRLQGITSLLRVCVPIHMRWTGVDNKALWHLKKSIRREACYERFALCLAFQPPLGLLDVNPGTNIIPISF